MTEDIKHELDTYTFPGFQNFFYPWEQVFNQELIHSSTKILGEIGFSSSMVIKANKSLEAQWEGRQCHSDILDYTHIYSLQILCCDLYDCWLR